MVVSFLKLLSRVPAIAYADMSTKQSLGIFRAGTLMSLARIRSSGDDDGNLYTI